MFLQWQCLAQRPLCTESEFNQSNLRKWNKRASILVENEERSFSISAESFEIWFLFAPIELSTLLAIYRYVDSSYKFEAYYTITLISHVFIWSTMWLIVIRIYKRGQSILQTILIEFSSTNDRQLAKSNSHRINEWRVNAILVCVYLERSNNHKQVSEIETPVNDPASPAPRQLCRVLCTLSRTVSKRDTYRFN